jgi:hypothetical protein
MAPTPSIAARNSPPRAGKTTLACLILGRSALFGLKAASLDADFNRALTDWVSTAAKSLITVRHELDETKIVRWSPSFTTPATLW